MRTLLRRLYCPLKEQTALFFRFQNRSNTIREELSSVLECPYRLSSQLLFKTIIEFLFESAADNSHTWGLLFFICKERATGIVKAKPPLLKYFYLCYFFTVFFFWIDAMWTCASVWRYTHADFKISLYVCVHIKTMPWKFSIFNLKNSGTIYTWGL